MDVVYTLRVLNTYQKDSYVRDKMEAISIVAVEQERVDQFAVHTDATIIVASGEITRTITATLTADFLTQFPTFDMRIEGLKGAFKNVFAQMMPAEVFEGIGLV